MNDIAIDVKDVTIRFNLASEKIDNLKEYFVKLIKHELLFQEFLAVRDASFTIRKGEAWALVGSNGSGKSTLMKLLVSDDASIGRIDNIILDGKPVDAADISSLFAYSSQYPVVLADTLWFNLTLGRKIGKQRVMDVCKSLDLDDIVREKGFDYVLSADGTGMSGGQLARIELARAVLSERPILLLDEINASLDSRTDMDIHHYLWDSNLTFIEIIHHYKKEDLKNYDAVIDVSDYS